MDHELDGIGLETERLRGAADPRDVAVMIRTPHVDQVIEPTGELVDQVRAIGAEVRVPAVAPHEDTVLVVAERRRAEPDGALGLIGVARGAELVDRLRDLALAGERRLGDVGVEPDVEPCEGRVDPAQDALGGSPTHRGQPLFIRERCPPGFRGRELATELIDVRAVVAVLGDLGRTSEMAQVARVHRGAEAVHLTAGVVVVVLALHAPSGGIEQTGERVAEHGVPRVPDVQGPGRVRAHELHLDALFGPRCRPVRGSLGRDPA